MNRRQFTLGSTSLLLSGLVPMKAKSSIYNNKKNLVVIMLRGAMDGLTSVPYIHDNTLEKVRPDIFVKKLLNIKKDSSNQFEEQLKCFIYKIKHEKKGNSFLSLITHKFTDNLWKLTNDKK